MGDWTVNSKLEKRAMHFASQADRKKAPSPSWLPHFTESDDLMEVLFGSFFTACRVNGGSRYLRLL